MWRFVNASWKKTCQPMHLLCNIHNVWHFYQQVVSSAWGFQFSIEGWVGCLCVGGHIPEIKTNWCFYLQNVLFESNFRVKMYKVCTLIDPIRYSELQMNFPWFQSLFKVWNSSTVFSLIKTRQILHSYMWDYI